MRFLVKAEVSLKRGHFDPEGDVAAKSLRDLGFSVGVVRVSKAYTMEIDARDPVEAKALAEDMCRKLLANPTKDDFRVEVTVIEGRTA